MRTNCAPLLADLFLFCYERDLMLYLSDVNNLKLLKLLILLLGILMTYSILIKTCLITWPIMFTRQNFSSIRPTSQIPSLIFGFIFIYIGWFCQD